jgi:hypothetical protein
MTCGTKKVKKVNPSDFGVERAGMTSPGASDREE